MQLRVVVAVLACALEGSAAAGAQQGRIPIKQFGPDGCVSLRRLLSGSCALATHCEGRDLSNVEFAFDCLLAENGGSLVRHSFGTGGFDAREDFDTGVRCQACMLPEQAEADSEQPAADVAPAADAQQNDEAATPTHFAAMPAAHRRLHGSRQQHQRQLHSRRAPKAAHPGHRSRSGRRSLHGRVPSATRLAAQKPQRAQQSLRAPGIRNSHATVLDARQDQEPSVVYFGPSACVSTYLGANGTCMMETDCASADTTGYEYGFVCVDEDGSPVRHSFGTDSFDPVETFDTLISCEQCLGLEKVPDDIALAGHVDVLDANVAKMNAKVNWLERMVEKETGKRYTAPPPAPVAAPPPPPSLRGKRQDSDFEIGDEDDDGEESDPEPEPAAEPAGEDGDEEEQAPEPTDEDEESESDATPDATAAPSSDDDGGWDLNPFDGQ